MQVAVVVRVRDDHVWDERLVQQLVFEVLLGVPVRGVHFEHFQYPLSVRPVELLLKYGVLHPVGPGLLLLSVLLEVDRVLHGELHTGGPQGESSMDHLLVLSLFELA